MIGRLARSAAWAWGPPAPDSPSRPRQLALLALAAGLSGFTLLRNISPHDEGLVLQAGARIASGQWPYRDFWTNYAPGQPLLIAGLDRVFGVSLLSWRILRVALDATVSLLAYRLARRQASEPLALAAWLAVAGAMAFPTGPGPNPAALALALGAVLAARSAPLAAGALAGLAVLFRIEVGVAAAVGLLLVAPPGRRAAALGASMGVAVLVLAPFAAVAPDSMADDTIGFLGLQHLQRLPFPLDFDGPLRTSKLIEFYIPLVLVTSAGLWLAAIAGQAASRRARRVAADEDAVGGTALRSESLALAPLALVGVLYLLARTDEFHLVPLAATLPILLAAACANERRLAIRVALLAALALIAAHGLERRAGQALHPPALADVPGPAGDGVQTTRPDARALAGLLRAVRSQTAPREPIFVANPRHDLVRVGDPLLYVILDHPNPTRYDVMQPGLTTTAPVQREIVRALERSRTHVVVRWLDPTASRPEPNGAGRSSGVHILDRYLASNFAQYRRFGPYALLRRRPAPTGATRG